MLDTGESRMVENAPTRDLTRLLALAYAAFLVAICVIADLGALPKPRDLIEQYTPYTMLFGSLPRQIPYDDKIAHFFLVGTLAFFVAIAWRRPRWSIGPLQLHPGSLIILLLITIEECSQLWFPARSFTWSDLFSGAMGVVCFDQLLWLLTRRQASLV